MASLPSSSLCLSAALLLLLAAGAAARPCKTLFVSYYTISSSNHPKPAFLEFSGSNNDQNHKPPEFFVFAEFHHVGPRRSHPLPTHMAHPELPGAGERPLGQHGNPMDVLGVVTSLLFGVGCGILASVAMYLVWLVVTGFGSRENEAEEEEEYVKPAKVDDYVKVPAEPVKEGYEGN